MYCLAVRLVMLATNSDVSLVQVSLVPEVWGRDQLYVQV